MKSDYDFWLEERRSWFAEDGKASHIEYQFKRSTHEEFRSDLCELLARYPARVRQPCDPKVVEVIWRQVNDVLGDGQLLLKSELPSDIVAGTQKPLVERGTWRLYENGIEANAVYIAAAGVDRGFRWAYNRNRFHVCRDYDVDADGRLIGVSLATLMACSQPINTELATELAKKIKTSVPVLESAAPRKGRRREVISRTFTASEIATWEPLEVPPPARPIAGTPRQLTDEQELEIVKRFLAKATVISLADQFGVSRPTIDKVLMKYGQKKSRKKSNWMG